MIRIKPVELEQADAGTAKTLKAVKAKLGILPNLISTLAQSPAALNGYLQLSETLGRGRLSASQRELIAIAVAQENSCEYCLSAHTAIGKGCGLDEGAIAQARMGGASSATDAEILQFALQVVRARGAVEDEDLERIRKLYGDDGVAIEIVANVVVNILTNYVNLVARTEVDFPVVKLGSVA